MKEGSNGVSVWQPRGRQVYTGRGEESSCYCMSLGTSFIYSTVLLLTSCPHTRNHYLAYIYPCFIAGTLFIWFSLEPLIKPLKTLQLCLQSAFLFLVSFYQLPFSPNSPLPSKLRALPSSCLSLLSTSTCPHIQWELDIYPALTHLSLCCLIPYKQAITIILCSCSFPPQNWQLPKYFNINWETELSTHIYLARTKEKVLAAKSTFDITILQFWSTSESYSAYTQYDFIWVISLLHLYSVACLPRFSTTHIRTLPQGKAHSSLWRLFIEIKSRNKEVAADKQYLWVTFSICSNASACFVVWVIKNQTRILLPGANNDTSSSTHICLHLPKNSLLCQDLTHISIKHLHFQHSDRTKFNFILLLCMQFLLSELPHLDLQQPHNRGVLCRCTHPATVSTNKPLSTESASAHCSFGLMSLHLHIPASLSSLPLWWWGELMEGEPGISESWRGRNNTLLTSDLLSISDLNPNWCCESSDLLFHWNRHKWMMFSNTGNKCC